PLMSWGQREPGQCARKKSGWIRMARRTRFAAWMMAALMVSSAASAQSDEADFDEVAAEELAEDTADADTLEDGAEIDVAHAPDSARMGSDYIPPDRSNEAGSPEIDEGLAA